jgi:hypothetical protein
MVRASYIIQAHLEYNYNIKQYRYRGNEFLPLPLINPV